MRQRSGNETAQRKNRQAIGMALAACCPDHICLVSETGDKDVIKVLPTHPPGLTAAFLRVAHVRRAASLEGIK